MLIMGLCNGAFSPTHNNLLHADPTTLHQFVVRCAHGITNCFRSVGPVSKALGGTI